MASRSGDKGGSSRGEIVTSTGWRIHGSAADLVSPAAMAGLAAPENETDIVFAGAFHVRPKLGADPLTPVFTILQSAVSAAHPDLRPLPRDGALNEITGRFSGVSWDTLRDGDRWTGELLWLHSHPAVSGVPCTTHVVISDQPGRLHVTIRVGTPGGSAAVRGPVGMGQSRPAFLTDLHRRVRLMFEGSTSDAKMLTAGDIPSFVRDVLLSETRALPVVVVAPTEAGEYLVPLDTLAEELSGLAHLYAMDRHPTTFRLTDELGDRRLSCYWGAMRVYRPEFSCADAPELHPLLVDERIIDPVMRADILGQLAILARRRIAAPVGVAEMKLERSRAAVQSTSSPARAPAAPDTPMPAGGSAMAAPALAARIEELGNALGQLLKMTETLVDEVTGLRVTTNVRAGNASNVERRIGQLERLLREHLRGAAPASGDADMLEAAAHQTDEIAREDAAERTTLVSAVRQAATTHSDALLILDSAEASAADSPYDDVERVANVLEAMALIARRRQAGTLGESLRDAFRKSGIDYRGGIAAGTSARMLQQYEARLPNGERVACDEHVVLGNSRDPRFCLRIYFTSRAASEARFVIPHIGRHFDVKTTD